MLQLSPHAAFAQRVTQRCHLEPLSLEVTLAYIQHHLKVAGLKDGAVLFSDDALKRIADWAQGIPRRINQVCTAALIAGAVAKAKVIDDTPLLFVWSDRGAVYSGRAPPFNSDANTIPLTSIIPGSYDSPI